MSIVSDKNEPGTSTHVAAADDHDAERNGDEEDEQNQGL